VTYPQTDFRQKTSSGQTKWRHSGNESRLHRETHGRTPKISARNNCQNTIIAKILAPTFCNASTLETSSWGRTDQVLLIESASHGWACLFVRDSLLREIVWTVLPVPRSNTGCKPKAEGNRCRVQCRSFHGKKLNPLRHKTMGPLYTWNLQRLRPK